MNLNCKLEINYTQVQSLIQVFCTRKKKHKGLCQRNQAKAPLSLFHKLDDLDHSMHIQWLYEQYKETITWLIGCLNAMLHLKRIEGQSE